MKSIVWVDPKESRDGFAVVRLEDDSGSLCELDLEFRKLLPLRRISEIALDFLLLASAIYALDKLVRRNDAPDAWTRDMAVAVPVSEPGKWQAAAADLGECLSFLTGDRWQVSFFQRNSPLLRPVRGRRRRRSIPVPHGDVVCLFSGGLDSLVGAIDQLESQQHQRLLLVGHHDRQIKGVLADQNRLLEQFPSEYSARARALLVRVGQQEQAPEITLRSRSLVFIALAVVAAAANESGTPILIPENGTIALNVPLTPSRRGSCSTRTAHPHYLHMLQLVLAQVGLNHSIHNPLAMKTKGEAVAQCLNRTAIKLLAPSSVSCAKRGRHRTHSLHTDAAACGICMPCVYRRAALHTVGLDTEQYGRDFCRGEVNLDDRTIQGPNDLRACFSFLNRRPSTEEMQRMLLTSGRLDPVQLPAYADLVERAMNEIRLLVRDKAVPGIRRRVNVD